MNWIMYKMSGVTRPKASSEMLTTLGDNYDDVATAASECVISTREAIDTILETEQGDTTNAFESYAFDPLNGLAYLGKLYEAARRTRDAHHAVSDAVSSTVDSMDAVTSTAGWDYFKAGLILDRVERYRRMAEVVATMRRDMLALEDGATTTAQHELGEWQLDLPPMLANTADQRIGSVPPLMLDVWENGTDEERMEMMGNIHEDVMSDWPDDWQPRPQLIFYTFNEDDPPPAVYLGGDDERAHWEGYLGVASGGNTWLNVAYIDKNDPSALSTTVHELQHIEQGFMMEELDDYVSANKDFVEQVRNGDIPDPFLDYGSSVDEVQRFQSPYYQPEGEDKPYYWRQYKEIDANRAGTEYLDNLPPDKVEDLIP